MAWSDPTTAGLQPGSALPAPAATHASHTGPEARTDASAPAARAVVDLLQTATGAAAVVLFAVDEPDRTAVPLGTSDGLAALAPFRLSDETRAGADGCVRPARSLRLPSALALRLGAQPLQALVSLYPLGPERAVGLLVAWTLAPVDPGSAERLAATLLRHLPALADQAGHELERQRLRRGFDAIMQALPVGAVLVDPDGPVAIVNQVAARLLGLPAGEQRAALLAERMAALRMRSADPARIERDLAAIVVDPRATTDDEWSVDQRRIRAVSRPIDEQTGTGRMWVFEDVTRAHEAARSVRESETRLRLVTENIRDAVALGTADGRWLYASPAIRTIFDCPPERWLALGPLAFAVDGERDRLAAALVRLAAGQPAAEATLRIAGPSGAPDRWVEATFVAFGDRTAARHVIASFHDATSRVLREAALEDARREAERTARARADFLATMSHEIRTPLTGMLGMTELLLGTPLDDEQGGYVRMQRAAGQALKSILDDVLDLSRLEAGALPLAREPFVLGTLLERCGALARAQAAAKGLEFRIEIADTVPVTIIGDEGRLQQVLLNLLGNAIKFTDTGSVALRLSCSRPSCLRYEIVDTGTGIPPERQGELFERFRQVDQSLARRHGGTGLGLAICRALVETMGGTIGVDNAPGRGATFWFALPLERTDVETDAAEVPLTAAAPLPGPVPESNSEPLLPEPIPEPSPRQPLERPPAARAAERAARRILVAEDVLINQTIIRAFLGRAGYAVDVVDDGEQAVEAVKRRRYDAVVMDLQMPVMDGLTATRAIRAAEQPPAHIPIVALSASAMTDEVDRCFAAGMDAHVAKPIDRDRLLSTLSDLLREKARPG